MYIHTTFLAATMLRIWRWYLINFNHRISPLAMSLRVHLSLRKRVTNYSVRRSQSTYIYVCVCIWKRVEWIQRACGGLLRSIHLRIHNLSRGVCWRSCLHLPNRVNGSRSKYQPRGTLYVARTSCTPGRCQDRQRTFVPTNFRKTIPNVEIYHVNRMRMF